MARNDKVQFERMLDRVRGIVAGAEMFDPRSRRKIVTNADKLWTELRNARKRQLLAGWAVRDVSVGR
jgi:hypothetical protein